MKINDVLNEGLPGGEYSRVLTALKLYYPDKFSMEELNTPEWHRVIANKADVPTEYAGDVIDGFVKASQRNDDDDEQGMAEQQLNELFDDQQEYFKLADGQVIRVDYKQAGLNPDGMPGSINIVPVDPKIMPMSGMQAIQPWDKARQNIRMAIQKWVQSGQKSVAEGLNEFAPAGGGSGNTPRGPRTPGRDPWDGNDSGEDPYSRPEPEYYSRSIDYFGQFEADHFDDEEFDKATGVFKGYWDDAEGRVQIGYFKFDDPAATGSDDPGMGWYYEPQNESVAEGLSEMDKSQTPPGRDGGTDLTKKQIHLGPEHVIKAKDVAKHALKALDKTMKKSHADTPKKKGVAEGIDDEDYGPELAALQKEFGKFTTHYDRMDQDPAYAAQWRKQNTDRLNQQGPDDEDTIGAAADDMSYDMGDDDNVREGNLNTKYSLKNMFGDVKSLDNLSLEQLNKAMDGRVNIVGRKFRGQEGNSFRYDVKLDNGNSYIMHIIYVHGLIDAWLTDEENNKIPLSKVKPQGVAEGKPKEKEADYGADYQDMVSRVKKLAGLGPLKTVYDPQKRVYKNVPTAVQPKKEQR